MVDCFSRAQAYVRMFLNSSESQNGTYSVMYKNYGRVNVLISSDAGNRKFNLFIQELMSRE